MYILDARTVVPTFWDLSDALRELTNMDCWVVPPEFPTE